MTNKESSLIFWLRRTNYLGLCGVSSLKRDCKLIIIKIKDNNILNLEKQLNRINRRQLKLINNK